MIDCRSDWVSVAAYWSIVSANIDKSVWPVAIQNEVGSVFCFILSDNGHKQVYDARITVSYVI
jgi:hypothetical protein